MNRKNGRKPDQLRAITFDTDFLTTPEGAALVSFGDTRVLCTATVEESVPNWLDGSGQGWVTAEYNMLPRAVQSRKRRERGHLSGRTQEIQRLIGRSLRGAIELRQLGERMIIVDCDVIQADGGTRTASVTGGFIALYQAVQWLLDRDKLIDDPITDYVAAVSVGIVEGDILLDLCYQEDSTADVDMNIVMNGAGELIEIQGTAEAAAFGVDELNRMVTVGGGGVKQLIEMQQQLLDPSSQ